MYSISWIFIIFLSFSTSQCYKTFQNYPKMYKSDNYTECTGRQGLFCEARFKLSPNQNYNNSLWSQIQEAEKNIYEISKSSILRKMCIQSSNNNDPAIISSHATDRINKELKTFGLSGKLMDISCEYDAKPFDITEIIFISVVILYITLILYATLHHLMSWKTKENPEILYSFSIIKNFQKMITIITNEDYQRLKCMSGMKFYLSIYIVFGHSMVSMGLMYVSNPEYVEQITGPTSLIFKFNIIAIFIVQPFLLMSGWLVAVQVYRINERFGTVHVKHIVLAFVNRILRMMSVIILPLFLNSMADKLSKDPTHNILFKNGKLSCSKNWWKALFFIQNWQNPYNMCIVSHWYLNIDVQLYFVSLIILYIVYRYKLNISNVLTGIFILFFVIHAWILNEIQEDIIPMFLPRCFTNMGDYCASFLQHSYYSTYSNATTYILGIIFGTIYCQNKTADFFKDNGVKFLWLINVIGLPYIAVYLTSLNVQSIIFGALSKPLFAAGFGIGIYGMANNVSGVAKIIFENRFVEIMGIISFCTYIFHIDVVFARSMTVDVVTITPEYIIHTIISDILMSLIVSFVMYLILEATTGNLIKLLMSKLMNMKEKEKTH